MASVHGRFQPFHLDHLDYVLRGLNMADYLYIGITQIFNRSPESISGSGVHRAEPDSNPFTFYERAQMIRAALAGEGIQESRYQIIPFPLERPSELSCFLPLDIPILTTRVDAWNDRKNEMLRDLGFKVSILVSREKASVRGSCIRSSMRDGNDQWTKMVPPTTVEFLRTLSARLR